MIPADIAVIDPAVTSPLEEYIGQAVLNDQDEWRRAADDFALQREEFIAACMRDAGFNYQPDLNSTRFSLGTSAFDDVHPDDRDWVAQFGFGAVSGHRHRSGGSIFDVRDDDPNADYVAALSETARAAYEYALYGSVDNPPQQTNTHAEWQDWMRTRGCWGQGVVAAQLDNPIFLTQSDEFAPLFSAIAEMNQAIWDRPELATLDGEWAHCMADAGHVGFSSPGEAESSFMGEYFMTSFLVQQQQAEGSVDDSVDLLGDLQAREIAVALADLDCREATSYAVRKAALRLEVETQFVADHRALLEDFRNATG